MLTLIGLTGIVSMIESLNLIISSAVTFILASQPMSEHMADMNECFRIADRCEYMRAAPAVHVSMAAT